MDRQIGWPTLDRKTLDRMTDDRNNTWWNDTWSIQHLTLHSLHVCVCVCVDWCIQLLHRGWRRAERTWVAQLKLKSPAVNCFMSVEFNDQLKLHVRAVHRCGAVRAVVTHSRLTLWFSWTSYLQLLFLRVRCLNDWSISEVSLFYRLRSFGC